MSREDKLAIAAHGFADDYLTPWWQPVRQRFDDWGYDVLEVDFDGLGRTVDSPEKYAHEVKDAIEAEYDNLCETCEFDDVTLVAHSMGGLTSRYCIEELGYDEEVDNLVTFGTPHQGTDAAEFARQWMPFIGLADGTWDLSPGSSFLEDLNGDGVSGQVDYINIYTPNDPLIPQTDRAAIPAENGNVENIEIGRDPYELATETMKDVTDVCTEIGKDVIRDVADGFEIAMKAVTDPMAPFNTEKQLRATNSKMVGLRAGQLYHASKIDREDLLTTHVTMMYNDEVWDELEKQL